MTDRLRDFHRWLIAKKKKSYNKKRFRVSRLCYIGRPAPRGWVKPVFPLIKLEWFRLLARGIKHSRGFVINGFNSTWHYSLFLSFCSLFIQLARAVCLFKLHIHGFMYIFRGALLYTSIFNFFFLSLKLQDSQNYYIIKPKFNLLQYADQAIFSFIINFD